MKNIFELCDELLSHSKEEIEYAILSLLIKEKLDFVSLNKLYVKYLEILKDDNELKLADANGCILSLLHNFKTENKSNSSSIHWALYNLNESKKFNMQSLNEKFGYNKDKDCKLSFYWRENNEL